MHRVRQYLAASILTLSSMQASAQSNTWQETHAFTFLASGTQSSWSDYLASDQPGVSRIAFGGYDETNALQSWDDALPYQPSPAPKTLPYGDTMQISVKDGYRITGYSLQSNVFSANLVALGWENDDDVYDKIAPGYANSSATLAVETRSADGSAIGAGQSKTLFNSSGELLVGAYGLSLTHDFHPLRCHADDGCKGTMGTYARSRSLSLLSLHLQPLAGPCQFPRYHADDLFRTNPVRSAGAADACHAAGRIGLDRLVLAQEGRSTEKAEQVVDRARALRR